MSNRDLEIMADERLQAETVALRRKLHKLEAELDRLRRLLLDCWYQFSDQRPDGSRHSGGLSALEDLQATLEAAGLIDEEGRPA